MKRKLNLAELSALRFSFAQCVFNSQIYEAAGNRAKNMSNYFKIVNIILTATTLMTLSFSCIPNIIGQITGIIEVTLQMVQWHFDVSQISSSYIETARQYLALRNEYLNLISDSQSFIIAPTELLMRKNALMDKYNYISSHALSTKVKDYRAAQKKLGLHGEGETHTWSEEEIDRFLPEALHIRNHQ